MGLLAPRRSAASIAVLVLLALALACSKPPGDRAAVAVRIETVSAASSLRGTRYSGTIQARTQVDLAFRIGGYVESIAAVPVLVPGAQGATAPASGIDAVESSSKRGKATAKASRRVDRPIQSGDRVTRDTVLAALRFGDFKNRLSEVSGMSAEASAGFRKAKADLDRARTLLAEKAMSQADFDAIKARHDSFAGAAGAAAARVGQAGLALGDAQLKAPFDGIVLERKIEVGALVVPGVPAFVLADTAMVKAVFGVPDGVQREFSLGQELTVSTDSTSDKVFPALITKIAAQADSKTRVFDVEATLDNAEGLLKVGMVTTIHVGRAERETDTQVVVPLSAVVRVPPNERGFWVYVAQTGPTGTVVMAREIELGTFVGNRVTVSRGLAVGEHVVVQGATLVTHGQHVNVVPDAPGPVTP